MILSSLKNLDYKAFCNSLLPGFTTGNQGYMFLIFGINDEIEFLYKGVCQFYTARHNKIISLEVTELYKYYIIEECGERRQYQEMGHEINEPLHTMITGVWEKEQPKTLQQHSSYIFNSLQHNRLSNTIYKSAKIK